MVYNSISINRTKYLYKNRFVSTVVKNNRYHFLSIYREADSYVNKPISMQKN